MNRHLCKWRYIRRFTHRKPKKMEEPVCVQDFEAFASRYLSKNAFDYYKSGADNECTLSDNVKSFHSYVNV